MITPQAAAAPTPAPAAAGYDADRAAGIDGCLVFEGTSRQSKAAAAAAGCDADRAAVWGAVQGLMALMALPGAVARSGYPVLCWERDVVEDSNGQHVWQLSYCAVRARAPLPPGPTLNCLHPGPHATPLLTPPPHIPQSALPSPHATSLLTILPHIPRSSCPSSPFPPFLTLHTG